MTTELGRSLSPPSSPRWPGPILRSLSILCNCAQRSASAIMGRHLRGDPLRQPVLIASLVLAALFCATRVHAQSVADFYARTPVRLIISADPGGSYDQIGRLLSRHLGRHIPG